MSAKSRFGRLERQKSRTLQKILAIPSEQLQRRPESGSWCILEVLDHVIRAERGVLHMMRQNLTAEHSTSVRETLKSVAVLVAMLLPVRIRMPDSVTSIRPKLPDGGLEEIREEWAKLRGELGAFIDALSESDLRKGLFCHPKGGWTTAAGAMLFLESHSFHHAYQLNRLKRSANARPSN
jgi:hypothetical protein